MRVQVPDVPDAGHFLPKPCEKVRLVGVIVRASTVRVLGLQPWASNMAYLEAVSVDFTEEGYGKLKVIEPLRVPQDLAVDAIRQRQSLFHLVEPPVNEQTRPSAQSDLENESSCALRPQVIGGDQDAVSKRSSRRVPRFGTRAVVAEFAIGVPVHVVRAPVSADPRLEINRRLGLRVEICGDLDKDLVAHARFRATELSEETDASAFRLERQDPGEAPTHDLAFNRPSSFIKHVATLPFEFQQEACGTKMLGFVPHGWWLLVSRDRSSAAKASSEGPDGALGPPSSAPGLGGELDAVVPGGGVRRARDDGILALDLNAGDFRLALGANFRVALEKAHGPNLLSG
jgi:hypothetical protein